MRGRLRGRRCARVTMARVVGTPVKSVPGSAAVRFRPALWAAASSAGEGAWMAVLMGFLQCWNVARSRASARCGNGVTSIAGIDSTLLLGRDCRGYV